jgi:hypothetical protein
LARVAEPLPDPSPPEQARRTDADGERSQAIVRALAALGESRYAEAELRCRELAELEGDADAKASWADTAELLDRLARAKPVAAFMQGYSIRLPEELSPVLVERLAAELELAGQPLLGMATLDWIETSSFASNERRRLARELDPGLAEDERERVRAVAKRVVEHFRDAAEARDVRALRASARALIDLGQPREALVRVREALEREPGHLATRLTEVDLLGETGELDARRALLVELAAAFPEAVAPARRLAEDFARNAEAEAGALAEASYWYAETLAREFDEAVVLDFARLLERTGRVGEAIAQLEVGYARSTDPQCQEDFARELARIQRERGQLQQAQRWKKEVERRVGIRERGYAVAAIALMIILLAVLVVFAVLYD